VGAWDFGFSVTDTPALTSYAERLAAWARKGLREGKLRSGWAQPNEVYEQELVDFIMALLAPDRSKAFLSDVAAFVARIGPAGAVNGLAQMVLRCTLPGLPDTYQGTEFWDFSLVDPDNRRPVDFAARQVALKDFRDGETTLERLTDSWRDGRIKQAMLQTLLAYRHREPALFSDGSYEPLEVKGRRRRHVLAFLRCHEGRAAMVIVPRLVAGGLTGRSLVPDADWWDDTTVVGIPRVSDCSTVIGSNWSPRTAIWLADALPSLPVGVWSLGLT